MCKNPWKTENKTMFINLDVEMSVGKFHVEKLYWKLLSWNTEKGMIENPLKRHPFKRARNPQNLCNLCLLCYLNYM